MSCILNRYVRYLPARLHPAAYLSADRCRSSSSLGDRWLLEGGGSGGAGGGGAGAGPGGGGQG